MIVKILPLRAHGFVTETAEGERFIERVKRNATVIRDRIDVPGLRLRTFDLGPPTIRRALVDRLRGQIAAGAYLSPTKLDVVADRLSHTILDPGSRD